jgi:hypothetical protein
VQPHTADWEQLVKYTWNYLVSSKLFFAKQTNVLERFFQRKLVFRLTVPVPVPAVRARVALLTFLQLFFVAICQPILENF